jgi:hypothetical protein
MADTSLLFAVAPEIFINARRDGTVYRRNFVSTAAFELPDGKLSGALSKPKQDHPIGRFSFVAWRDQKLLPKPTGDQCPQCSCNVGRPAITGKIVKPASASH